MPNAEQSLLTIDGSMSPNISAISRRVKVAKFSMSKNDTGGKWGTGSLGRRLIVLLRSNFEGGLQKFDVQVSYSRATRAKLEWFLKS